MTRKEFIKNFAALGAGLPFLSLFLESCDKENGLLYPDFDVNFSGKVIVIGAGAAGLTAGYLLNKYNIDFQIIEASSVFGGRIKRDNTFADFPIDIGAEWIHEDPSILAKLISDASINAEIDVITYSPDTVYNFKNNKLKKQNFGGNFYSEYKFKNTTWYGFFEKYIASNISNKIVYNSPVNKINYSGEKVTINTTNGHSFEADKVLVTVPIKILQEGSIDFVPSLPATKKAAIDSIEMPDGLKVFIEFSEKFYPDILFTGGLLSEVQAQDKLFYNAAFGKDSDKNVLGLFVVGKKATAYTSLADDNAIFNAILVELDSIFDGKASQTYIKHIVQNWSKEPFVQGSYSYVFNASEEETVKTLLEPLDNKVFFAGEALSADNGATVPGAGETAYAVIETMLK
ncbi:MAG: FAD-dependent oxidoreductase [Aureispira sp.]|nr:FAD-dependent oxidoreductase [Aureispira sp.]